MGCHVRIGIDINKITFGTFMVSHKINWQHNHKCNRIFDLSFGVDRFYRRKSKSDGLDCSPPCVAAVIGLVFNNFYCRTGSLLACLPLRVP